MLEKGGSFLVKRNAKQTKESRTNNKNKAETVNDTKSDVEERWKMRRKENSLVKKIVFSIIFVGVLLILVVGIVGYNYVTNALRPLEPNNTELVEVEIPMGSSTKRIAEILEEEAIVKDATVFNYYMKTQNASDFQAGFYQFAPSMELDEIIVTLEEGGTSTPISEDYKILVKEGSMITEIASEFASKTEYSEKDFLDAASNDEFIAQLAEEFPKLITDAVQNDSLKYKLEGYLFPATYDYLSMYTPEDMIREMVQKTNEVLTPYRAKIEESGLSLHEVLTLSSLVEKEGVQYEDRQMIADVFFNRLEEDMAIQSDISILYALDEHKEYVTIADTEVDSPYNLYQNKGLGPGPFNNPGEEAIQAVLNPTDTDYFYFLADLETGEVYFSETYEEHLELQDQYIIAPEEE
ncbi:MAG TPA: endolytic transglycosylase MltG [Candidatus Jeotgalibaca pullicola]|nr:endolytic transglycosylase MltG [Candidatus Jeotgalibaca pullicola]